MKIQEFIQGRNVKYATVFQYIKRNTDIFSEHIGKANNIELDDEAIRVLEKKYPLEKPVRVIEDTKARESLLKVQEKLIDALEQISVLQRENADLKLVQQSQNLLEAELNEKDSELRQLRREQAGWVEAFQNRENEVEKVEALLDREREEYRKQLVKLQYQLDVEKNRTWWDRLLRR